MTDVHVSSRKTREDRQTNLELLRVKIFFPSAQMAQTLLEGRETLLPK